MANPQAENGYTKIANEILEALCKINLSSYQSRLLFLVIRKTYGFNKTDDWISNSQIVEATGISKSHASRAKKELIERRIIVTPTGNKMKFNKDYNQWRELPKGATHTKLPIGDRKLPKGDTELPKGGNTKETIQKKLTKETTTTKILRILGMSDKKNLTTSIQELLEKHNEALVERVAMKVALKSGSPDVRWLQFVNWCATEKQDKPQLEMTREEKIKKYNKL